ncbi:MAG: 4-hydroxy-tetrahydrodipicolinate synthase [bacterium]
MYNPEGIIVAMVTPMKSNEDIDEDRIRKLVNRYIEKGVHGIFCLSTNGEFFTLDMKEKTKIMEIVVEESRGRIPVLAGTGGITTREVIELSKKAEKMKFDAVSVITPYFLTPSQNELYDHYRKIAETVSLPIILYNLPGRTGVCLEPDTVAKLSEIDNIIGIKDSSGDFKKILRYINLTGEDFFVLSGNDSLILWTLLAGGDGAVSGMANIIPELVVSIYNYWQNGKTEKARLYQEKLRPLRDAMKLHTFPSLVKKAMEIQGCPVGPSRDPVSAPSTELAEKISEILEQYQL